ncbi:hypothetical protein ACVWZA_001875 [Sphingomonas sp. UYAg733]
MRHSRGMMNSGRLLGLSCVFSVGSEFSPPSIGRECADVIRFEAAHTRLGIDDVARDFEVWRAKRWDGKMTMHGVPKTLLGPSKYCVSSA